jgi:hypothetical protein
MQSLQTPTPELVRQYIRKFDDGGDGIIDRALLELFRTFPRNDRFESILFKVLGLNALYSTGIIAVQPVAKHILSLNIDTKLALGAPELVNEIARTPTGSGGIRRNYSFATKYCSWHVPEAYPIFDSVVESVISEYQRMDRFADHLWKYQLSDYLTFKHTMETFRQYYSLTEFSFKDLDKFLWRYGKAAQSQSL